MSIDLIFKIAAIGIIITVANQILTNMKRDDLATLVTLTGLGVVLLMVIPMINDLFKSVISIFGLY
jgi:stage III sporulation protein AC